MPVIDKAFHIWTRLAPKWSGYLLAAGLDLTKTSLATFAGDLSRQIHVNFKLPGLEDFSRSGCRGIEPGDPARSLLYHAMASPGVTPHGLADEDYPTPADIQAIENLVYGISPPSLADLRVRAEGSPLAIVVFAYEYVPAVDTVHKCHADLCFARTGNTRVGNTAPRYIPKARGYLPFSETDKQMVHVVPGRYGAFIATTRKGDRKTIGPSRFQAGDEKRDFWIPLQKLFDGPDCVDGFDLRVELSSHHVNEKIRRLHMALQSEGFPTPWSPREMNDFPFRITEGIANLGEGADNGLLTPVAHNLVEVARKRDRKIVWFPMPHGHAVIDSALWFPDQQEARHSPELVHVRHEVVGQQVVPLRIPKGKTIDDVIDAGGYRAANFVDYSGDGWVEAKCVALNAYLPKRQAAYSLVAQPDFFPLVKQKSLMDWWENSAPAEIKDNLFPFQDGPFPLSDERTPPNITLTGAGFDSADQTMTAIVGIPRPARVPGRIRPFLVQRESVLPLRATGLFFPGFDCSKDFNRDDRSPQGVLHLALYGIGSPFAEDTMLCAAHGSFWPAAVPDTTRFFAPGRYPSVTPIMDSDAGWDGVPLPKKRGKKLEFKSVAYTDYVQPILDGSLGFGSFARITLDQYVARTLAMARVFQVLGANTLDKKTKWSVVEFEPAKEGDLRKLPKRPAAFDLARTFKLRMAQVALPSTPLPGHADVTVATPAKYESLLASPGAVARQVTGNGWDITEF